MPWVKTKWPETILCEVWFTGSDEIAIRPIKDLWRESLGEWVYEKKGIWQEFAALRGYHKLHIVEHLTERAYEAVHRGHRVGVMIDPYNVANVYVIDNNLENVDDSPVVEGVAYSPV